MRQIRCICRITCANLSTDHQKLGLGNLRERANKRLASFALVEKAKIAEEDFVVCDAEAGAPRSSLIVWRRVVEMLEPMGIKVKSPKSKAKSVE